MTATYHRAKGLLLFVFVAIAPLAPADSWLPPPASRTAVAIDGSSRMVESAAGDRRVIKAYIGSEPGSEILSWQADLLNCPAQLFVSPRGKTVVTMDRWHSIGADALVFYTAGGAVVKRYEKAQGALIDNAESAKGDEIRKLVPLERRSAGRLYDGRGIFLDLAGLGASANFRCHDGQHGRRRRLQGGFRTRPAGGPEDGGNDGQIRCSGRAHRCSAAGGLVSWGSRAPVAAKART